MLLARLLGQFDIRLNDRPVEISSRPAQSLIAYLLLNHDRPHRREKLAGLFWPEAGEANARSNLRHALWRIRKAIHPHEDRYLQADDLAVTFTLQPGDWLDAVFLESRREQDASTAELIELATAYGGELLPGFYEEWVVLERERFQAVYERKLNRLLECLLTEQRWEDVINWSERWIAQGRTPEPAFRALIFAYAGLGDRAGAAAAYQRGAEALRRELGVEPSTQTRQAYEAMMLDHTITITSPTPTATQPASTTRALEDQIDSQSEETTAFYVGKKAALAKLEDYLSAVTQGDAQVVFIQGEAGSGKTSLLRELVRQALHKIPELIPACGSCSDFGGAGDPYLPFRDILGMLTGDLDASCLGDRLTRAHARCLRSAFPHTLTTLLEQGPGLISSLVPGPSLLARAGAILGARDERVKTLRLAVEQSQAGFSVQEKSALFEQYTRFLRALSDQGPVLIVLDDLQWADPGSIQLLFHLGRRLARDRVLILGAYRSDEVAAGRGADRHPLEPFIHEMTRLYGEIFLDLDQVDENAARDFIDAYLDREPNHLGKSFRQALYRRTHGQPLFTIELLRSLQERGGLTRDEAGAWTASPTLDWGRLPARVEGVIAERIDQLEPRLQQILRAASVEGEEFYVQVLKRTAGMNEHELIHALSQDLQRRYRLVQEEGVVTVGDHVVTRYRFSHALVQNSLYNQLSAGERRLFHREAAQALEELYQEDSSPATIALARHYAAAGENEKALPYLLRAGDQARLLYAHTEAIACYEQGLEIQRRLGDYSGEARTWLKLGLTHQSTFDFVRAQQAYAAGQRLWNQAGEIRLGSSLPPAPHALRMNLSPPYSLDPMNSWELMTNIIDDQIFSGLVALTPDMNLVPALAQRWEIEAGGHRYRFHLREDASWSDGMPVTAQDFEFAWKRVLNPQLGSDTASLLYDLRGAREYHEGGSIGADQVGVHAQDDGFTLIVDLEQPTSYFPYILCYPVSYAVPRHHIARYGEAWAEPGRIVTNGPFLIDGWIPERKITLRRNPRYSGPFTGNLEQIEVYSNLQPEEYVRAYTEGELDILNFFVGSSSEQQRLRKLFMGESLFTPKLISTYYLGFNTTLPPLNDNRVRRALAMAIDRKKLVIDNPFDNPVPATGGFVPPGLPGHTAEISLPYDPDQARQILAKAGFPGRIKFPILRLITQQVEVDHLLATLQYQWRENLGIDLSWESGISLDNFKEQWKQEAAHLIFNGWIADYPDPANFLSQSIHPLAYTKWENEPYSLLIDQARRSFVQQDRLELYRQAERLLVKEIPILPLFYYSKGATTMIKPWVRRFPYSDICDWFWKDIVLEPHAE